MCLMRCQWCPMFLYGNAGIKERFCIRNGCSLLCCWTGQCHEIEMSVHGSKGRSTKDTQRTINLLLSYVQVYHLYAYTV